VHSVYNCTGNGVLDPYMDGSAQSLVSRSALPTLLDSGNVGVMVGMAGANAELIPTAKSTTGVTHLSSRTEGSHPLLSVGEAAPRQDQRPLSGVPAMWSAAAATGSDCSQANVSLIKYMRVALTVSPLWLRFALQSR